MKLFKQFAKGVERFDENYQGKGFFKKQLWLYMQAYRMMYNKLPQWMKDNWEDLKK